MDGDFSVVAYYAARAFPARVAVQMWSGSHRDPLALYDDDALNQVSLRFSPIDIARFRPARFERRQRDRHLSYDALLRHFLSLSTICEFSSGC